MAPEDVDNDAAVEKIETNEENKKGEFDNVAAVAKIENSDDEGENKEVDISGDTVEKMKNSERNEGNEKLNLLMERLKNFQAYSTTVIQHAIDSSIYRGPDDCSNLNDFLKHLDAIASIMDQWIRTTLDSVDHEEDTILNKVPFSFLYELSIEKCHRSYFKRRIQHVAYFNNRIELAREMFDDIVTSGKHILTMCPSLETPSEIYGLSDTLSILMGILYEIDMVQVAFEHKEKWIAAWSGSNKKVTGSSCVEWI